MLGSVGPCELLEKIGSGGMGTVYRARHSHCRDADIHRLIAGNLYSTDNAARIAAYSEINRLIVTRIYGIAPYWQENHHYLINPDVIGMRENMGLQDQLVAGDWFPESWGRRR